MDTVLSVAEGQVDSEEYYLDLDTDAGVEDFDFKLDGAYEDDETQQRSAEALPEDAANTNGDFEIGYEDDEGQAVPTEGRNADGQDVETSHDAEFGEGPPMEYQDEIGYEDEEPATTNASTGQEAGDTGTPNLGKPGSIPEGHEAYQGGSDAEIQMLEAVLDPHGDQYSVFGEPNEGQSLQGGFDDPQSHDMLGHDDSAGLEVDTTESSAHQSHLSQGRTPPSGPGGLDESVGISATPSTVPEITVHYNQGQYSLIGAPTDDPDSYFLSDEKGLEGSLSEFLGSIRAVISDEVSVEDELTIRIDALDLEFGERSNQKFLGRSFHEIVACYSALATGSSKPVSYDPHSLDLELLIRRDCEARFLDLLEEAGIVSELSHLPDHFDDLQGVSSAKTQTDDHLYGDESADDYSEYDADNDDVAIDGRDDASQASAGDEKQTEAKTAHENDDGIMGGSLDLHGSPNGPGSASLSQPGPSGEAIYEEQYQEFHYEGYDETGNAEEEEPYAAGVDVSGEPHDEFAADQNLTESELTFDIMKQPLKGPDGVRWSGEASEQAAIDAGNTSLAESLAHDDNVALTLDGDAAQSAVHEQSDPSHHDVGDTNTAQNGGDPTAQALSNATGKIVSNDLIDASEAKSRHTSRTSTIKGDEISFEETDLANEFLAPNQEAGQASEVLGLEGDEIDWENDGDEPEQKTALTPSSVSGKRNRTNDAEGLSDEADYKRRRT